MEQTLAFFVVFVVVIVVGLFVLISHEIGCHDMTFL